MEHPERVLLGLGRALQKARKNHDLSQEQLASHTGVHRNYIGGVERGERSPTVLVVAKLAAALDVTLAELFHLAEAEVEHGT
jgi:transcriptional regulator with XRE-family HTH domain